MRDSAALLDATCQPVRGDNNFLMPPQKVFTEEVKCEPGKLRIGYVPGALMSQSLDPEIAGAVEETARLCAALGHRVEETRINADFESLKTKANVILSANMALMLQRIGEARGHAVTEDEVEGVVWIMVQDGLHASGVDLSDGFAAIYQFNRIVGAMFEKYDVLLMATLGQLPVRVGDLSITKVEKGPYTNALYRFMPNTQPFNINGSPAMSVPLAWSNSGLPIGIQFVAANGDEATLFRLAGQLETERPWAQRRPKDAQFLN